MATSMQPVEDAPSPKTFPAKHEGRRREVPLGRPAKQSKGAGANQKQVWLSVIGFGRMRYKTRAFAAAFGAPGGLFQGSALLQGPGWVRRDAGSDLVAPLSQSKGQIQALAGPGN